MSTASLRFSEWTQHHLSGRTRGFLTLMRPYTWLWFLLLPLTVLFFLLDPKPIHVLRYLAFLLAAVAADAGCTTINDVYDVESDRLSAESDRRMRPLVLGLVTRRQALQLAAVLLSLSLFLAFLAAPRFAAGLLAALGLGLVYSMPPARLNARPWASQIFWLVLYAAGYLIVGLMAGTLWTTSSLLYFVAMGLFMGVAETLAKDIRDWDNDARADKRTSVVALGPARAARYSRLTCFLATALLLAFLWRFLDAALWVRILASALLFWWLRRVVALTRILEDRFDKAAGAKLHTGYIRTYLLFNILAVVGLRNEIWSVLRW
jgi:4-hydroxybenzoate polyprenyltransferase